MRHDEKVQKLFDEVQVHAAGGLAETEGDRNFARDIVFGIAAPPDEKMH